MKYLPRALFGLLLALSVSACSNSSRAETDSPYAADLAAAKARAQGGLAQQILDDGVITRAEYTAAIQSVVSCMRAKGFDTKEELNAASGLYQYRTVEKDDPSTAEVEGPDSGPAINECEVPVADVVAIYSAIQRNPRKLDEDVLTLSCLKHKKVVAGDFTLVDFRHAKEAGFAGPEIDGNDQRVADCLVNPSAS
jgi:hypothetical protein